MNSSRKVTPSQLDALNRDHSTPVFVFYFADWCGHCTRVKPTWEKLPQLFGSRVHCVMFNVDQPGAAPVLQREGVRSFPTIKLYVKGVAHVYNGDRSRESLIDFVCQKSRTCI